MRDASPLFFPLNPSPARQALRRTLRALRRNLSPQQRRRYSAQLARRLIAHPVFIRSQHIAFYLPNEGEMDLSPVLERAWAMHKTCYLPVLRAYRQPRLWFLPYHRDERLSLNRYGIAEPPPHCLPGCARRPWALDLVLMPLVGFDEQGNRLGMGGGYYDRSFAYLCRHRVWRQPRLLGIAYEFQRVSPGVLQPAPWDVPLWGAVTENGVYTF